MGKSCNTCDHFVKRVCRADADKDVDPLGDCPTWEPRDVPTSPRGPEHAALIEAIALLLRGYPAIWYQQADVIARVLKATQGPAPKWGDLAHKIQGLAIWCPGPQRRAFRRACRRAGA